MSTLQPNIFENQQFLHPAYNHLEKYVFIMYKGFWTPAKYEKLIRDQDAPYYFNEMGEVDQEAVKRCILAVAIVEDKVKSFWCNLNIDLPQTIISDVGGVFGQSEVTHRRSYHALLENLNIDVSEIHDYEETGGRIKYLSKHLERDPRIIGRKHSLKKLVLFTSLVERASLFTQFYILMSYAYRNRGLKTISALQRSTAVEELIHYSFGIDVINIIKKESPQLWADYLVELVEKNILAAHDAELKLIDWFFEKGVPEHLTKEEVINFLNFNFAQIVQDLELDISFPYDEKMYEERNLWMMEEITTQIEPDFFDNAVGGYSSTDEQIDLDNFEF